MVDFFKSMVYTTVAEWGSGYPTGLITQRALVRFQPPQPTHMKILGIDVGRTWAWSFYDGIYESASNKTDLYDFGGMIKDILDLYKPEVVVTARPTRFHAVIASQSKTLGVLEYFCKKRGIKYIEYIDSHCKKVVLENGRAKKEDVMSFFDETNEHIADAKMFIHTYLKEG